jgi:Protein of unknown function (DUF3570)
MQLKEKPCLRTALAAASCGLLGIASPITAAADGGDTTQADTALLYYAEHGRVNVTEATARVEQPLGDDETVTVTPTVDVITGASPNGATMSDQPQTFSSADTTPANTLPVKHFYDRRFAIDLEWEQPIDRLTRSVLGASASTEKDYNSLGASASLTRDYNNKLTTLSAGISGSLDSVEPAGGIVPRGLTPLASAYAVASADPVGSSGSEDFFSPHIEDILATPAAVSTSLVHAVTTASGAVIGTGSGGTTTIVNGGTSRQSKKKESVDGIIGVTQVVNHRTLTQLNYSLGVSSGYLTDPYKIISMVDGTTGETLDYRTELRPDSRLRQSFYWKAVYHLTEDVIHISYRYYWDDWGIRSNTVDLHYHFDLGGDFYVEPQFRYYTQSAADFYHHSLVDGATLPRYASADYRLAQMTSTSYGLKLAMTIGKDSELSARVTYMKQTGNSHPADAIGGQRSLNLYPGLDAVFAQLGYIFTF